MRADWPGVLDETVFNGEHVEQVHRLADAARDGAWETVFALVDPDGPLSPNQWRVGGTSWFTPLHQAAWLGAPVEIAQHLLRRGAWRSLRTADGDRPVDIARARGHEHLLEILAAEEVDGRRRQTFDAWDRHLAELIAERTENVTPVRFRPVPTEIIAAEGFESLWFAYPGMYGGFDMSIHKNRLLVESWCRVVGGSGQAHVITERGRVLVDRGFV